MTHKIREFGADFSLLLVAIAWGCTFIPVQQAVEETPVYIFLFWRFIVATLLMGILAFKHFKALDRRTIYGGIVLGVFLFLGFAFQTFGLTYTYSSTVAFITGLNVVIVPFILLIVFKKRASLYSNVGAIIAAVGLYFLTSKGEITAGLGELYTLVCAFMFAAQIAFTGHYVKHCNIYTLVVVQLFTVSLLSFFGAVALDGTVMPKAFDGLFVNAVIITAVFATVFAFFVQTAMQRFTTPAKTAIIFTMEPVSAGLAGYFFASELLGTLQIFGAVLILGGVLVAELGTYLRDKRREKKVNA